MYNVAAVEPAMVVLGEDEHEIRSYLEIGLRCQGYQVQSACDGDGVLSVLRKGAPVSAVLLDIMMPTRDGFDTLREIRRMSADIPVIMLSGSASPSKVIQAMQYGATDFLAKPASHEDLGHALRKALRGTSGQKLTQSAGSVESQADRMIYGSNAEMLRLRTMVQKVAQSDIPVLIQGETGTGKEVIARQIHAQSARADKPFVKLNCAAVPADLMESELFGCERGAYTGAFQKRAGIFELADGGTLMLDEIGDMDIRLQAKLLQALQDHEYRRLGGKETVRVDIRVIAATHRNLETAIADGAFRADLYYRLNVLSLYVPALRHRREDIPAMAAFLIQKHSNRELATSLFTPALDAALLSYPWPGNVRELENIVRKLIVLRDPDLIAADLSRGNRPNSYPIPILEEPKLAEAHVPMLERALRDKNQAEVEAITAVLNSTHWNRKQAAAILGIDYKALLYKMRKLHIDE